MPTYRKTNITAKKGLNYARSAVEEGGSLFHKIEAENDLGIDALIELIRDERPLNRQVAVQIKSGPSYYNSSGNECLIPVEHHRDYWLNHPLPVIGIVYIPSLNVAHWVDIKEYLKAHPDRTVIRFSRRETNRFDPKAFSRYFIPAVLSEVPDLSLSEAFRFLGSENPDESYLGLLAIFRRYPNSLEGWDRLIQYFIDTDVANTPSVLIYFLAHIPWHGDIWYKGEDITQNTRAHVKARMASFSHIEVIKLLDFIDEEESIARGTLGQSVEAIISSLPGVVGVLENIVLDSSHPTFRRECAAIILAMKQGKAAIPTIEVLKDVESWWVDELIEHIHSYGGFSPYA